MQYDLTAISVLELAIARIHLLIYRREHVRIDPQVWAATDVLSQCIGLFPAPLERVFEGNYRCVPACEYEPSMLSPELKERFFEPVP